MTDLELLRGVELFSDLTTEQLDAIIDRSRHLDMARNDVAFEETDEARSLFVVEDGRIAIVNRSVDGRESVIALMERGDLFGEMALFDRQVRSAEARALERSHVIEIPYEPLEELYGKHPEMLWKVVALLAGRLRATDEALADSVFLDVTGRTAKRLLELSNGAEEFSLPVTQEELAGMVGASRERVNKAIASFVRLGWIEQSDRRYRVVNREQLEIRAR